MSRLYAYIIAGVGALAMGVAIGWHFGSLHWKGEYQDLKAADWEAKAQGEKTARDELQRRLDGVNATITHNAEVMNELNEKRATAESQLDLARRLLGAAKASGASCSARVPQADSGSRAAPARPAESDRGPGNVPESSRLGELLERAVAASGVECKNNANQLDALIQQIQPQL